jgi:quercetin dioxygenase-like cupin family protein
MITRPRPSNTHRDVASFLWIMTVGLLVSACGTGAAASPKGSPTVSLASATGFVSTVVANGQVDALPTGTLFANIISIAQPANSAIPAHSHVAAFIYVVTGSQILTLQGQPPVTIQAGSATFMPNMVSHIHANPGSSPNLWYVIGVRPRGVNTVPPNVIATLVYATPDLPAFVPGAYSERLLLATLQPGGRSAAHLHSGLEVILVLDGTLTLHSLGQSARSLSAGQGAYILSRTTLQVINTGATVGHYLAFVVWPSNQPFITNVNQVP